ncbi:MAG: terminase large subunit [Planctomycetaceae bacterium]|nr:terminase large subunit [Planctomycetaceae bacterium]
MNLRALQSDPDVFRRAVVIDCGGIPQPFGNVIESWQQADFVALDPAWLSVAGQAISGRSVYRRAWLERPRGHSKTGDIAVMVSWSLFASRRKLTGVVAAADADQATLLRNAIDTLTRLNPWLASILDVQQTVVRNRHTGSELQILTSDAPSSYGISPAFVIADELTHWSKPDLWESLLSSAAKRPGCLLVVITNAGFGESWQWELREAVRHRPEWWFSRLDGPCASWITANVLAEQRALLPDIAYRRLWLNEWTSGSGDAFREFDLRAIATLPGPLTGPERGWVYVIGLDIGLRHDSTALVVVGKHVGHVERRPHPVRTIREPIFRALVDAGLADDSEQATDDDELTIHPGSGRLKLAALRVWTPTAGTTVNLAAVEDELRTLSDRFGSALVAADPYQAVMLLQSLSRTRRTVEVPATAENLRGMASSLLDAVQDRTIDLFPDATLQADLRSLRVVEKSYGIRLEAPRRKGGQGTRHADTASALQLAVFAARRLSGERMALAARPMVLYPCN